MAVCVGCGLTVNGAGVLIVDRNPDSTASGIDCSDANGLSLSIQHTNPSTCITVGGLGTTASPLTVSPVISPDACNGLSCRANGFYAHCPDSIIRSVNVGNTGTTFPQPMVAGGTYNSLSLCTATDNSTCVPGLGTQAIQVCNTLCCTVRGMWDAQAGGVVIDNASADFIADYSLGTSTNGGAYGASPVTTERIQTFGTSGKTFKIGNLEDVNFVELAPAACVSFSAQFTIVVVSGTATWSIGPEFEFHWQFNQTGCC